MQASGSTRYFVGVGAQKAGTTWLAEYFYAHPDVFMAPYKEMNFFNAKYLPLHQHRNWLLWLRRRSIDLRKYGANNSILTEEQSRKLHNQFLLSCLRSERAYRRFLDMGLEGKKVAGEITPCYTDLAARHFERISHCLPGCKYLFLVRSPVARFISQFRMQRANRAWGHRLDLRGALEHPHFRNRSDYARTLRELLSVTEPSRVLVVFYEYLFDPQRSASEVGRICDFLGIRRMEGDISRIANAAKGEGLAVPPEDSRLIASTLRDSYECLSRLAGGALPEAWKEEWRLVG